MDLKSKFNVNRNFSDRTYCLEIAFRFVALILASVDRQAGENDAEQMNRSV